jgi:hypothetical protein
MNPTSASGAARQSPQGDPPRPGDNTPRSPVAPRSRRAASTFLPGVRWLTTRDQVILTLLEQHRTLTTNQIALIAFGHPSTARNRLYQLRRAGWVDCFTPVRAGRAIGTHWVLAYAGARWAANADGPDNAPDHGRTPPSPRELRDRNEAIAASSHLTHTDGQNQFFVDLLVAAAARRADGETLTRLARWWSPARTSAALGQRVHPDGHGVWEQPDPITGRLRQVGFLLEYDTGTEPLTRLVAKIEPYRRLRQDSNGPDYPVLFWLPTATREHNFHTAIAHAGVPAGMVIATTHAAFHATATADDAHHPDDIGDTASDGPAAAVWKIVGNGSRRHALADLPSIPGEAGPHHPGPPASAEAPTGLLVSTL